MIDQSDLDNRFTYHPPSAARIIKHTMIREHGKALAELINFEILDSREKSLAITKVEEAIMWANAAIARSEE